MANMVRVIAQDSPSLYRFLGLVDERHCTQTISIPGRDATYYRDKSTPKWVLYKAAIQGTQSFDLSQR